MENLWIVFQDLSCYDFLIRRLHRWVLRSDFLDDFFNDISDFYCFAVKICVRDVISAFSSIVWLTSLIKDFLNHLWNLEFYEHLLKLKINSEYLNSAKLICPNYWVLVLSFWFWISILKKLC